MVTFIQHRLIGCFATAAILRMVTCMSKARGGLWLWRDRATQGYNSQSQPLYKEEKLGSTKQMVR